MKAATALISVNERLTLKVLLQPETQQERDFLRDAIARDPDVAVSFSDTSGDGNGMET